MHEEIPGTNGGRQAATGRLMVCERSGPWAAALRRELAEAGVRVWETRSLAECWESLAAAPASFLIVELTLARCRRPVAADGAAAARLSRWPEVAVVAARPLAGWQWLVREAGAVDFSFRRGGWRPWPKWPAATWPACPCRRKA